MDAARAKEILHSAERVSVEYAGVPVWIDDVDENENIARVHTEGNPQESRTVAITELKEK
ncbi:H-type small acid-soluble spore protein [Brevibacillus humidisoli]|uniref:H-type small acid-soluble spore protein n=1 Tax=Brevibacillus humidisoli TaxID=2895522 RepID=UPI001E4EDBE0|nr:H-type small acid-soluble spore protein [Brevibacillus humidisoli]UFJ39968.1 H-type small acid-soluble spore protein [Brevibacillus humidisoli]